MIAVLRDSHMKNDLLKSLTRPVITENQKQLLLTKGKIKRRVRATLIHFLKFSGSVVAASILFIVLLFAGHYSGFEDFIHSMG